MPKLAKKAYEGLTVCAACGQIRGTIPGEPDKVQLCDCDCERRRSAGEPLPPKWERFDFNQAFELCKCCGVVVLRSGSRWSVWFCDDCKERVMALNAGVGCALIPIGRHSMMAGIGLSGADLQHGVKQASRSFFDASKSLFERIDHLYECARRLALLNLAKLGVAPEDGEIDLDVFVAGAAPDSTDKDAALGRLLEQWFAHPFQQVDETP